MSRFCLCKNSQKQFADSWNIEELQLKSVEKSGLPRNPCRCKIRIGNEAKKQIDEMILLISNN